MKATTSHVFRTPDENAARMANDAFESHMTDALKGEFPGCFKHGKCRSMIVGTPHCPEKMTFYVKKGNGELIERPLLDVPFALWESDLYQFVAATQPYTEAGKLWRQLAGTLMSARERGLS